MSDDQGAIPDWTFISDREGGQRLTGYTLDVTRSPNAGLTIGTGIDIGQMTDAQIDDLPISDSAKETLKTFTGLQGQDAVDAYNTYVADNGGPPTIDKADADALDQSAGQSTLDQVSANYSAATGRDFSDLPAGTQTAILDVAYQYGPNLATAAPHFWSDVVDADWDAVVDELNNFHDNYGSRRQAEAQLVQSDIDQGAFDSTDDSDAADEQADHDDKWDGGPGVGVTR